MELDRTLCYGALKTRDPRFDGRFFICVSTTGIYCRPVCPARIPLAKNCSFVTTAAAAQQKGYRPCLRCRPECAPGAPAWRGTGAVAGRALKLIADGALDDSGVDALAARTGMGARHLRRLVRAHAGASPVELARTRRILFAKRLITDTPLKITEIAFASGFRSLRRFNTEMAAALGRSPRDFRRTNSQAGSDPALVLPLIYRPPYDWAGVLAFLAARAVPGIERVEDGQYFRNFQIDGAKGRVAVSHDPVRRSLVARIDIDRLGVLDKLVARLRTMFDLDADPVTIAAEFKGDAMIAPRLKAVPGLRLVQSFDPYEAGLRAIAGQQISVKGAATLLGRLAAAHGGYFPAPARLAEADLTGLGFTKARAETLKTWGRFAMDAHAVEALRFDLDGAVKTLCALPGFGPWTAHYICLRGLAHTDAFPSGDLGLKQSSGLDARALEARAEDWRPWRAYAAQALWRVAAV